MAAEHEGPIWSGEGSIPRFGELARHLRKVRRLSQNELARAARLSSSTVRGWEAGRNEPNTAQFVRWSRTLGLHPSLAAAVQATLVAPRVWTGCPGIGIGPYLRERRLAQGTTLERLASDLGLGQSTLGHYESGRMEIPAGLLRALGERLSLDPAETDILAGGPRRFLEWCDSLVERLDGIQESVYGAAFDATPKGSVEKWAALVRLRTGLLRARLRGPAWDDWERQATCLHASSLAAAGRRTEATVALASARLPQGGEPGWYAAMLLITRRLLGRAQAEELVALADETADQAIAGWLRAEAAFDLVARKRGAESLHLVVEAKREAEASDQWHESWMRGRDVVRIALRIRDWQAADAEIDAIATLVPRNIREAGWYVGQQTILRAKLEEGYVTGRSVHA